MLEKHNFKARLLDGFDESNDICFKTVSGESGDVNVHEADD